MIPNRYNIIYRMWRVVLLSVLLGAVSSIPVELETGASNDRYAESADLAVPVKAVRHGDDDHTHEPATEEDIQLSMDEIAAQLISDPLAAKDNVAGNTPPEGIEVITEGQAKVVVDHIKGLLSDIYTNSIVRGETQEDISVKSEMVEETVTENQEAGKEPTILELFSHLDQNTVHDKESLLSIIQEFTTNSLVTDDFKSAPTTPNLFIFQDLDTTTTTTTTTTAQPVVRDVTTTTTTTPTTTRRTTTTTTTTTTSTAPAPQPTPPTVFNLIDRGFGGIFSGLGNVASTIFTGRPLFNEGGDQDQSQQSNPWFIFGRKKRDVADSSPSYAAAARDRVTAHQIFQKFRQE